MTKRLQSWATVGFAAIQQRLPEPWATRMGDRRLVSGIAGLLLIGGWIVFVGLPGSFTQPVDHPTVTAPPPRPAAPVPLQLTPVPPLIASIQAEVAAVVDRYSEGHIQSMQANFRNSRLTVVISGWDDLSTDRQKQLAAELLARSQSLNFQQLELIDREGSQLARSPVVGTTMVLVGRDYP
ncbi:MAG: hypothetical protein HC881_21630 [Leptolyngbyaceae cyanobacterium SL_7_1]|nr:hypothetical protein [Leptolyngbyaceae cyanobacterium SL_7_1]